MLHAYGLIQGKSKSDLALRWCYLKPKEAHLRQKTLNRAFRPKKQLERSDKTRLLGQNQLNLKLNSVGLDIVGYS